MGHMDVIPIISDGFNIYFPIMIVLLCICTYFSLGSRILHFLGINQFIGDDDLTQELVDEGKEIVKRGKTINISLEMLLMLQQMRESKLHQKLQMCVTSNTQKIQFSDWPK